MTTHLRDGETARQIAATCIGLGASRQTNPKDEHGRSMAELLLAASELDELEAEGRRERRRLHGVLQDVGEALDIPVGARISAEIVGYAERLKGSCRGAHTSMHDYRDKYLESESTLSKLVAALFEFVGKGGYVRADKLRSTLASLKIDDPVATKAMRDADAGWGGPDHYSMGEIAGKKYGKPDESDLDKLYRRWTAAPGGTSAEAAAFSALLVALVDAAKQ